MNKSIATTLLLMLLWANFGYSALVNGSFETGDFTAWKAIGDACIQTAAFGSGPTEGIYQAALTNSDPGSNYLLSGYPSVSEVDTKLGLPQGTLDSITAPASPPYWGLVVRGSALQQTFYGNAGDTLTFDYNYLTNDGLNWDFCFFTLNSQNLLYVQKLAGNYMLPPGVTALLPSETIFSRETGFNTFSFNLLTSGNYIFNIGVVQMGDGFRDSGLIIDDFKITPAPIPAAVWLLGTGLAGLIGIKKLKRNRSA
jgi:hypothetical protein